MSEHTKEPWFIHEEDDYLEISSDTRKGMVPICSVSVGFNGSFEDEQQDNASRIVACVNACAGIDTAILEHQDGVTHAVAALIQQRDELLAALDGILTDPCFITEYDKQPNIEAARAAIAKVKAEQS